MIKKRILLLFLFMLLLISTMGAVGCSVDKEAGKPLVLLTDFGSADYRVSLNKGIIYTNNPDVKLIEASEEVPAFDIPIDSTRICIF